jgi:hypothetical protein
MKRVRISEWPSLRVHLHPRTLERIKDTAERRSVPISVIVRETLDRTWRSEVL